MTMTYKGKLLTNPVYKSNVGNTEICLQLDNNVIREFTITGRLAEGCCKWLGRGDTIIVDADSTNIVKSISFTGDDTK